MLPSASTSGASHYSSLSSIHIRDLSIFCSIQHPHQGPLNILLHTASTSEASHYSAQFCIHIRGSGASPYSAPLSIHMRGLLLFCSIQHPHQGPLNIMLDSASTSGVSQYSAPSASTSGSCQYSAPISIHIRGLSIFCSIPHPYQGPFNILLHSLST